MRKKYTTFENIYDDKDPYVYRDLALVGYEYDRSTKTYDVYGYDFIKNSKGYWYLGTSLVSMTVDNMDDLKEIKKHVYPLFTDSKGRFGYRG